MSDIRTLYATLADTAIAFTDTDGNAKSITGRDLHETRENEDAALPVRVLLPWRDRGSGATDLQLLTVGTSDVFGTMRWRVADILLWEKVGQRYGLYKVLPDLVLYCGAYAEKIADAGRDLGIGTMTFAGLQLDATIVEWPVGSGNEYYGVEAIVTYEELINP